MSDYVISALTEASQSLQNFIAQPDSIRKIHTATDLLVKTIKQGGRIISCGNGGSMCDAMHFAEELTGRYRKDRKPLPGECISDAAHLSCISNDFGYDYVFSRYVESHMRQGDCLVAISTSGNSGNVIKAAEKAKEKGISVITLTGREGSQLESLSDVCIVAQAGQWADRVQELHIKILHIFIEGIERQIFPENYKDI